MKNIHVLPTDKPSRLHLQNGNLVLHRLQYTLVAQHIYITSDEEIKEGVNQWYLDKVLNKPRNSSGSQYGENQNVIILTTDQDLIKDGVQAIDDEFLEWFVKNPSCERVEVKSWIKTYEDGSSFDRMDYEVIISKKEPKQERMYSEEKIDKILQKLEEIKIMINVR